MSAKSLFVSLPSSEKPKAMALKLVAGERLFVIASRIVASAVP